LKNASINQKIEIINEYENDKKNQSESSSISCESETDKTKIFLKKL